MAEPTGKGSLLFKLIIAVLVVVVIAAILYPDREWKRQTAERDLCRLHMENVYYTNLQYLKNFRSYNSDLESLISFIDTDSMMAPPGMFEIERLTIWGSHRDSFLVDYPDKFHYEKMEWESHAPGSLTVRLAPKDRFQRNPESKMVFSSEDSIYAQYRGKGIEDRTAYIWGKNRIDYQRVAVDSIYLPTKYFAVSEDPQVFKRCPTSGEPYGITMNVRVKLRGEIDYVVRRQGEGNVKDSEFLCNLFVHKLRSDAATEAVNYMKSDTALFKQKESVATQMALGGMPPDTVQISPQDSAKIAVIRDSLLTFIRDSMTTYNFMKAFTDLKPKSKVLIDEEAGRVVPVDSIPNWEDSLRIKNTLFLADLTDKEKELKASDEIQAMLARLDAVEKYFIAGVDSVGLTIACPIDSIYYEPRRNIIQRIFGVGPAENHGRIKNGDYSWSEKK